MNDNTKRLFQVLEKLLEQKVKYPLFSEETPKEKLRLRCLLANDLKRRGIEIPPDNIEIK